MLGFVALLEAIEMDVGQPLPVEVKDCERLLPRFLGDKPHRPHLRQLGWHRERIARIVILGHEARLVIADEHVPSIDRFDLDVERRGDLTRPQPGVDVILFGGRL